MANLPLFPPVLPLRDFLRHTPTFHHNFPLVVVACPKSDAAKWGNVLDEANSVWPWISKNAPTSSEEESSRPPARKRDECDPALLRNGRSATWVGFARRSLKLAAPEDRPGFFDDPLCKQSEKQRLACCVALSRESVEDVRGRRSSFSWGELLGRAEPVPPRKINGGTTSVSSQKFLGTGRSLSLQPDRKQKGHPEGCPFELLWNAPNYGQPVEVFEEPGLPAIWSRKLMLSKVFLPGSSRIKTTLCKTAPAGTIGKACAGFCRFKR